MSWNVAGGVAAGAFLLSLISAGLGGSPFLDMFLRALFWGVLALGSSLGIELFLKRTLPELFNPPEARGPEGGRALDEMGARVDITLDEERPFSSGELDPEDDLARVPRQEVPQASSVPAADAELQGAEAGEELPEIGSFLESFRPQAILNGETAASEDLSSEVSGASSGAWGAAESRTPTGDVILDGRAHDPTVLAKAVQTVLKKGQ